MKITVITVCFNAANTLERTIQSIKEQTYWDIEYIIIDGKSTDTTINIIKQYEKYVTHWISEPDKGVFDAMNKGLSLATGDYVIFMNAGDYFADANTIENVASYIVNNEVDVYHGDIYRDIKSQDHIWKSTPFYLNKRKIKGMNICHQAIFTKTSTAQIYKDGGSFKHIPLNIAIYDTNGISATNWKQTFLEEARICGYENSLLAYLILLKRSISYKIKSLHNK